MIVTGKQVAQDEQKAHETFIKESVSFVKEQDALKEIDDDLAEGFLTARYGKDASFKQACDNRHENPEAWKAALENARSSLAERFPGAGTVRSDIEAAKASIQGTSQEASQDTSDEDDPMKLFEMSDTEYRTFLMKKEREARSA